MSNKNDFDISPKVSQILEDRERNFLSMQSLPILIGLSGPTKAGKTMIARYIMSRFDFSYLNLSSILEQIAVDLGWRKRTEFYYKWQYLGWLAESLRKNYSEQILATKCMELLLEKLTYSNNRFVIDGILHPAEAFFFFKISGFNLIWIETPRELRLSSAVTWHLSDSYSAEEINLRDQYEQLEEDRGSPLQPNLKRCKKLSKYVITINKFDHANLFPPTEQTVNAIIDEVKKESTL